MADFSALKTAIQANIRTNGNEEITGAILQDILLSMVSTMGDGAINALAEALQAEITNRQNAVSGEATTRAEADSQLSGRINAEAQTRSEADTQLGNSITAITTRLNEGYVYAGIATPSTNPGTPAGKVFYIALQAGTYTNFSSLDVTKGINILKYNGTAWSQDNLLAIDNVPKKNGINMVTSGGIFANIGAFDISEYHKSDSTLATYADLTAALAALPSDFQKGGMSIKFVQSSDNKYVQFRLMNNDWSINVTDWQGVDDEPTVGSDNLVKSGGVFAINSVLLEENRIILNNGYSYSQLYSNNEKETGLLKDDGTIDSSYTNYETSMYLPTLATADSHRFFMIYAPFAEHNNYGGLPDNCVSLAYYKKTSASSAKFVASKRLYSAQTIFVPKGYCVRISVETNKVQTIKYHNSPYGAISIDESIKKFSSDIINLNNILPDVAIPINSSIMVNGGADMSAVGNQTVSVPIFDAEGKDYILITSNSQPSGGELRYLIQWYNTDGSDGGYTGWTNNGQIAVSKRFFRILVAIYDGSSYINLSPSDLDSCGIKFYGQKTQKDNILFNKKIAILGDSITAGGQYTTVLHNHANVTILNYGVSGTRIANYVNDDQSNSFLNRVSTMDDSADLAVVFGGVNDWGSGTILGSLSTLNDNSTFYGALYQMTTALINKYGAEKIIYMTPLHAQSPSAEKEEYTYNNGVLSPNKYGIAQGTGYLIDYVNAIIEIATLFSIQVIDLYHNVGICPLVPSNSTLYTQDGLHPNAAGGALIAKYIKPIIENTISKNVW